MRMIIRTYYCKHCNRYFDRLSDKRWVKSYCGATGIVAHMQLSTNKRKPKSAVRTGGKRKQTSAMR